MELLKAPSFAYSLYVLALQEALSKQLFKGGGLADGVQEHVHLHISRSALHQLGQRRPAWSRRGQVNTTHL